jgi:hypothetical protein
MKADGQEGMALKFGFGVKVYNRCQRDRDRMARAKRKEWMNGIISPRGAARKRKQPSTRTKEKVKNKKMRRSVLVVLQSVYCA